MSFLKFFSGPSPEKLEQKGDALFEAGLWGKARQTYEHAIHKLERQPGGAGDVQARVARKFIRCGEALAREHLQTAENYIEGGHFDEAKDMLKLAMEVTADTDLKEELEDRLNHLVLQDATETGQAMVEFPYEWEGDNGVEETSEEDYFFALCGPLPQEVRDDYLKYGTDFRTGYIALNRGDFQTAAYNLSRAMEQNPQPNSYIPMELATAYMNLGRLKEAQTLLEGFLRYHPQALPAYQLLCEIYWDQQDFHMAGELLSSIPDELTDSVAFVLLQGETLHRSGNLQGARDHYLGFIENYGWNDTVALELAIIYELLKEIEGAKNIYKEIIGRCNSCHARIDPAIKHRYAELCFADDMHGSDLLELYLSLAREIPDNASIYFDRISRLYELQENLLEAERFRAFAIRAETEKNGGGMIDDE